MFRITTKRCTVAALAAVPITIFASLTALAQPALQWSQTYSGAGLAEARGIAVDAVGVYIGGSTWAQGSQQDVLLVKYDLTGSPVWDRTWGGSLHEIGWSVATSATDVYLVGESRSYAVDHAGDLEGDAVVVKWSHDGVLDTSNSTDGWWARFSGDSNYWGTEIGLDVALDESGNVYVSGLSEIGYINHRAYVERYDPAGVKQWHQHYGASGYHRTSAGLGLALSGNSVYVAGHFNPDGSDQKVMVLKYGMDGTPAWTYFWGSGGAWEIAYDMVVSGGDMYLAGTVGPSSGPTDLLLLKIHDDGTSASFVDSAVFSGPGDDVGWGIEVTDSAVYVVGSTDVGGPTDALLLAYDTDLNPLWDLSSGGAENDVAYDVAFHDRCIYVTGSVGGSAFVNAYSVGAPIAGVTYDGDTLLSTEGNPTADANLIASLRDDEGNVLDIDGETVTFTLTGEGIAAPVVAVADSIDGAAQAAVALEPAIYLIEITLETSDVTGAGMLVVYNPEGGFATGGGWIVPEDNGENTHPNVRANFGFNARYRQDDPTGHIEFRYSDGYIDLKSTTIEQLVITGGRIVQFKGWARVNGEEGHWFFTKGIDDGEPGVGTDFFEIKTWAPGVDPEGDPTERAGGLLQGGNIVVHTH